MKKLYQYFILSLILIVPLFVYLGLKSFGTNHYALKRYIPEDIIEKTVDGKVVQDTVFHKIPDFNVVSQDNKTLTGANFKDKILVVDFFFTRCPGICPKMTSQLTRVQEIFNDIPEVQILSFTVDPEFDQPSVLKKYAEKFGADPKVWTMATTNSKTDVFNLGFYGFKVPSDTVDKFLHSEKIILVDKEKIIRGFYTGTDKKDVDRLTTEIGVLLYEYKNGESKIE